MTKGLFLVVIFLGFVFLTPVMNSLSNGFEDKTGCKATEEFPVSDNMSYTQSTPDSAGDSNGNFIIVWESYERDGSSYGIYAQRFDSTGKKISKEIQVNKYTQMSQSLPSVAFLPRTGWVVVWQSMKQDGSLNGVFGQMFDNNLNRIGSEFQINSYTTNNQEIPDVASDVNGNFVVVWQSEDQEGRGSEIYAQRFNHLGNKIGGEFRVNTYTKGTQAFPRIAMSAEGSFLVVWVDGPIIEDGADGSRGGIFAQIFDSEGNRIGAEIQVNDYTNEEQTSPDISVDKEGNFVITWTSFGQDGSLDGIFAQRFNRQGIKTGKEFQVNKQNIGNQDNPRISMKENREFVITWDTYDYENNKDLILAQRFDSEGYRIGEEIIVNEIREMELEPIVSVLSDGKYLFSWLAYHRDGLDQSVFSRIIDCSSDGCFNWIFDEYETDKDCGGLCPPCSEGKKCLLKEDCMEGICTGTCKSCEKDHCSNGVKDCDETDIDCGGSCASCSLGSACLLPEECSSEYCHDSVCDDHCTNSLMDIDENGIDCGGSCESCSKCDTGERFMVNTNPVWAFNIEASFNREGNFIAVWDNQCMSGKGESTSYNCGPFLQIFNTSLDKIGEEVKLMSGEQGCREKSNPDVVMFNDGSFGGAWFENMCSNFTLFFQRYTAAGEKEGKAIEIDTSLGYSFTPKVAGTPQYTAIAYMKYSIDSESLVFRIVKENSLSEIFNVTRMKIGDIKAYDVYEFENQIVVFWENSTSVQPYRDIHLSRYSNAGDFIEEVDMNRWNSPILEYYMDYDNRGNFLILWLFENNGLTEAHAARMDFQGRAKGNEIVIKGIEQWPQKALTIGTNDFIISGVIQGNDLPFPIKRIKAQRYDFSGNKLGNEFIVAQDNQRQLVGQRVFTDKKGRYLFFHIILFEYGFTIFGEPLECGADKCSNGIQDQGETDIDCGGSCPNKCPPPTLKILDFFPIQVIRDVDMIVGKKTLIRATIEYNSSNNESEDVTTKFFWDGKEIGSKTTEFKPNSIQNVDLWYYPEYEKGGIWIEGKIIFQNEIIEQERTLVDVYKSIDNITITFSPILTENNSPVYYGQTIENNILFINATYPLSHTALVVNYFPILNITYPNIPYGLIISSILIKMHLMSIFDNIESDVVIGVVPDNWLNDIGAFGYAGFSKPPMITVLIVDGLRETGSHEIGHVLGGLCDEYNKDYWDQQNYCKLCFFGLCVPTCLNNCKNGDGDKNGILDDACYPSGCRTGTIKEIFPWDQGKFNYSNLYNFMGPVTNSNTWVSKETYSHLLSQFRVREKEKHRSYNETRILLSGIYDNINNSVVFSNFYVIGEGRIDDESYYTSGDLNIKIIDDKQNLISNISFNISKNLFQENSSPDFPFTPFIFQLPYDNNTKEIIFSVNETRLNKVSRTENYPSIKIIDIGGTIFKNEIINIEWKGSDIDNDKLKYSVMISNNLGDSWKPIEVEYENQEYYFDSADFSNGKYLIKILATDGINTNSSVMKNPFFIENYIRGDTNDDKSMDIGDAIFILNYLFANGKKPDCEMSAETNGDNQIDIGDAVYLLSYLFANGPEIKGKIHKCNLKE